MTSVAGPGHLPAESRVALLVPGSAAYVDLVLALLADGVFPIPLDPALTRSERDHVLAPIAADLVVTTQQEGEVLLAARPGRSRSLPRGERDLWGFCADDVNLVLSPLHHSAPLRFATGTLLVGGRIVVPGKFDPQVVTRAIAEERPSTMFCVPTHLQRLFAHWDAVGVPDLSCFRLVAHAGAPCPVAVKRRLVELFPAGSTWEFYGSTEGQFTACRSEEWQQRPGTVGRARPGRTLSTDADGRIWCAVPQHARFTYLGAPEQTAAAWRDTPAGPAFTVGARQGI